MLSHNLEGLCVKVMSTDKSKRNSLKKCNELYCGHPILVEHVVSENSIEFGTLGLGPGGGGGVKLCCFLPGCVSMKLKEWVFFQSEMNEMNRMTGIKNGY